MMVFDYDSFDFRPADADTAHAEASAGTDAPRPTRDKGVGGKPPTHNRNRKSGRSKHASAGTPTRKTRKSPHRPPTPRRSPRLSPKRSSTHCRNKPR